MEQTPLQEQVHITSPTSTTEPQPIKPSTKIRNIISLSAAILGASFFMPWVIFFGGVISGLDIQRNFGSYKLVWLLPACAGLTLVMNMFGAPTRLIRRVAGLIPFAILLYSLNKLGTDLFQIILWGGWVALASGIVLIVTPSAAKPQPKA